MSFKGKFFLHFGKEYMQQGAIADQHEDYLFLQIDASPPIPSVQLVVHVDVVLDYFADNGCPTHEWLFFNSREEVDAYIAWMEEPDTTTPKIVSLNK
jgi:hypothetical protein